MRFLEFEQPIAELEAKIEQLRLVGTDSEVNISEEIDKLNKKSQELTKQIFSRLTPWQIVQLSRHPQRLHTSNYIKAIISNFQELHGDRCFADDKAIIGGIGLFEGKPVMLIGHEKGRDTQEKVRRNFGMAQPEGYRKAKRLMLLAEKFCLPIINFIDTPGAYPGVDAEARGQSQAIAENLKIMSTLKVPIICCIIGEGCSGGALGIGVGDRLLMLEYSYYSAISPEGCASILWKGTEKSAEAAQIMSLTANNHLTAGLIDEIIAEPLGSCYRNPTQMINNLKTSLLRNLTELQKIPIESLVTQRHERLMQIGE